MSMFARKSVPALAVLAALLVAPLAHAVTTPAPSSTPPAAHEMKAPPAKPAAMTKVDLNTATREELVALPQIGEVKADKIIAARPFKMKSELVSKGVVTKAEYAKLAPHVIAKMAPETARPLHHAAKPAVKASPKAAK
jgi:competence protein ComEA